MPILEELNRLIISIRNSISLIVSEVTGQITNTAQAIIDVRELDCGGQWVLYVKTATVAVGHALWLLLTPSFEEILEEYLHPKPGRRAGRRGQHGDRNRVPGRGGFLYLIFRNGIPDIDQEIADRIPGADIVRGRRLGDREWLFWTSVDVADRLLWWWLLIEASETFATTWMSELVRSGKCQANNDGFAQGTTALQTPFFNNTLWFDVDTIQGLHFENVQVLNNGIVHLPHEALEASVLAVAQGYFQITRDDTPGECSYEVGVKVILHTAAPWPDEEFEQLATITCAPNSTSLITVDAGGVGENTNSVSFHFIEGDHGGGPFTEFVCWADFSMNSRGGHVV